LTELCTRVDVIEGGDFLDIWLTNLVDDLLLFLKELIGIDFDLFRLGWFGLSRRSFRGWIAFGLLITALQICQLVYFFLLTPLLLRVDLRSDALHFRFFLRRYNRLTCLYSRSPSWHLPATTRLLRCLASLDSLILLGILLLQKRQTFLLFLLASFDRKSDHFLLLLAGTVRIFLSDP